MSGATSLKFFGMIYGTQKDYWVAYGSLNFNEEKPKSPQQEIRGKGANTYVYWVAESLFSDWF